MGFDEAGQVACAAQRYSRYAVTGAVQRGARQGCGRLHAVGQACLVGDSFTGIRSACGALICRRMLGRQGAARVLGGGRARHLYRVCWGLQDRSSRQARPIVTRCIQRGIGTCPGRHT